MQKRSKGHKTTPLAGFKNQKENKRGMYSNLNGKIQRSATVFAQNRQSDEEQFVGYDHFARARRGECTGSGSFFYCQQLMRFKQPLEKIRRELINRKGVVFHHDNARLHNTHIYGREGKGDVKRNRERKVKREKREREKRRRLRETAKAKEGGIKVRNDDRHR
ncbi:hypothetical protein EVAR_54697_1 [Eumeta japonica]|uniref:Histone-lysine N-methyltransferase SETMAR n=1 Tax=Eumeta variegata TaxID=151549 RepID=A0A4C1X574_EUMVA|nr:hypothetical protein EVAR_54697_1 [Eumeta japonica]